MAHLDKDPANLLEDVPHITYNPKGREVRQKILEALECCEMQAVVAAVRQPTGAIEMITNYQNLEDKLAYYLTAYDEDMILLANSNIRIVDIMIV